MHAKPSGYKINTFNNNDWISTNALFESDSNVMCSYTSQNTLCILIYSLQNEYVSSRSNLPERIPISLNKKDLAVIAGSYFDATTSCLLSRAAGVPGTARLPERLQRQSDKKSRRWVMAALHGISRISSLRSYLSHGFILWLGGHQQMTQLDFGTNTAGSCQVLFRFHCIFQ